MNLKTVRNLIIGLILILLSGAVGYNLGLRNFSLNTQGNKFNQIINIEEPPSKEVDFSLFWNVWGRLEQTYIDQSKLVPQEMVYGAISGMVSSLGDPYTVFLPPQEQQEAKEELEGTFEGIGAQLGMKDKHIIIVAPLSEMPAEKAGVKAGDWVVKVNDEETYGWTVPEAVNKIRGERGTVVVLTLLHEGEEKTVDIPITRGTILVRSVEWEKTYWQKENEDYQKEDNCTTCPAIAHLKLSRFGDKTNSEWNQAVEEIKKEYDQGKIKGVVLDMRNNPGGYLQGAVFIASEFLKHGLVVVTQEYYDGSQETYSVVRQGTLLDIPLLVLINKGSASASEIVAGALKDHQRALLLGEKSFGKGSIQEAQELPGGAGIHITTARWLLPKGEWINNTGVTPDIEVSPVEEETVDTQLKKAAITLLTK